MKNEKIINHENYKLVCEECDGDSIQVLAWVDANTNRYVDEGFLEEDDKWCGDCNKHVKFKTAKK